MKPFKFWTLTFGLMAMATALFGMISFAAPSAKRKHILKKPSAVVKIGQPYIAERRQAKPVPEDLNLQYLLWRNSADFKPLRKK